MKAAVITLSGLIAVNVVYCDMENARQRFRQGYETCARKMGVPSNEARIDTVLCAAVESGEILFSNGAYSPERALGIIEAMISDPVKLQQAYDIYFKCDREAVQAGAVGIGKSMRFLLCGSSLISLFLDS
ncbi:uncharacterized protein LOC116853092 [Odontomachus brunneus]|uniref:uncharacterized protein LOC116853092 n=1 Tax=Odontomachus brunneus TaxID=486640 RepID=UPI0013F1CF24|nr:uncharacterized protein LOC116853092 [Odontomachus brunneus]